MEEWFIALKAHCGTQKDDIEEKTLYGNQKELDKNIMELLNYYEH